jgi:hypothetical protein
MIMDIQNIAIDKIIPYWNNARNNSKAIKPVEESIKKFGFNQPLVVDKNLEIIVGHTRYFALLNLGYKEVPCIIADLDEEKARQYRIADNKTSEFASWDEDKLIRELRTMNVPADMQDFFFEPIEQLLGFDVNFTPANDYATEDMQAEEVQREFSQEMERQENEAFKKKTERIEGNLEQGKTEYIEMACPYCGEIIRMKK